MNSILYDRLVVGFLLLVTALPVAAVELPAAFGDRAVLQRDLPVAVWGWAEPGEKVEVSFGGQTHEAETDDTGRWEVTLDPMSANAQPQTLTVQKRLAACLVGRHLGG